MTRILKNGLKQSVAIISSYAYIRGHNNYGSLFQYYALQQYLNKFGVEAYWIRYMFPIRSMVYDFLIKCFVELRHGFRVSNIFSHVKVQADFKSFMHRKCRISAVKYRSIEQLYKFPPNADFYVAGSDQVWGGCLEPNYLTFVPKDKLKIAYAASFGKSELSYEHLKHITNWVKNFDAVSVREKSGISICDSMGVNAIQLLDPTLLLDDVDYISDNVQKIEKKKYVFCYFINENNLNNLHFNHIWEFCRENGMKLKITGIEGPETVIPLKFLCRCSPDSWLNHYKYADYIVTNTFHGTVFCIIFKKQFCVLLQEGGAAKQNERLLSILEIFGLQDRILKHNQSIKDVMEREIDWQYVESVKNEWRVKSDEFWNKIFK